MSCEPASGFIFEEDRVPARTVTVPVKPGTTANAPAGKSARAAKPDEDEDEDEDDENFE